MSWVSVTATTEEWTREANRLAMIIQRGPPTTPHARVGVLREALLAIAAENYQAGYTAGYAARPASVVPPPAQPDPIEIDLMRAMELAEACADDEIKAALKKLAMEVARLRRVTT